MSGGHQRLYGANAQITSYVYDSLGGLAEYSTAPNSVAGTQYLFADALGSTRLLTDNTGNSPRCLDYSPFGLDLPVGIGGRGDCYTQPGGVQGYPAGSADVATNKFTGKERDAETGLDYFGARYMSSAQGRFTSPDEFFKDSHVADPQSWNKYAYTRNNPVRYVDPKGEEATVATNCSTNQQNQTTCQVNISASFAVYSNPGSGLSQQQLNTAATTIQNSIQGAWTGSFQQDGVTYNVSTSVSVQVVGSEQAAAQSGAQNVIGLTNGNATATGDSIVNSRGLFANRDTGVWNINNLARGVAAHEFTHLLGVDDRSGNNPVLSNTNLLNNSAIPRTATGRDFGWGIQEAISGVNSWVRAPQTRSTRYGEVWDKPSTYSGRTTVRAPYLWWK